MSAPFTAATVLICTRDRPSLVTTAVDSVFASVPAPAEVVIVDQTARPHPVLATDDRVALRYLHRPGAGLARARNIGFRAATNAIVAIVDDDMTVDPTWLAALIAARAAADSVTTGRVLAAPLEPGQHPLPDAALITLDEPAVWRGRQRRDVVPGASVALPRDLVLALGGYDERLGAGTVFGSAEDNDLGLRLLDAGVEVRHVPEAVTWHRGRDSPADDRRIRFAYGTGKGALLAKHLRHGHVVRRVLGDAASRIARIARHGWNDRDLRVREFTYLCGLVVGFARWWTGGWWRRTDDQLDAAR
jgi:GT2 family glycosyltransferase